MSEQRVTLELSSPKNFTLIHAFVFFLILCVLAEAVGRSSFVQNRVPYQAYGTNHTQMEIQLTNLENFVHENGAPDCFIFGSSQAFRDVDADAFASALEANGGGHYTCYNFGVTGSQVATTAVLNKILIQKYKPRLVVIGTSFLDYTEGREIQVDERFTENDWLAYKTGDFSIAGWLTEHSYAWRTLTILSYSAPFAMNYIEVLREAHKWDGEIAPSGFALSEYSTNPNTPMDKGSVKNLVQEFGKFNVSERNLSALEQIIIDSQAVNAKVLIVEMPYHPALLDLKDERGNPRADRDDILGFQQNVNARIETIAGAHEAFYLETDAALIIPDDVWFDVYHLNRIGALLFGEWLGEQAAKLPNLISMLVGR